MGTSQRLALVLLTASVVATAAALFGPGQLVYGVDLGAAGAGAFVLCAVCCLWLFATRSDEIFPEHMSVAERRAWVGLVYLVLVLASLMREMLMLSGHAQFPEGLHDLFAHRFMQRYLLLAVTWSLIDYLVGRRGTGIEIDERDLRLQHRAERAGDWVLTLIVIGAIIVLALIPQQLLSWWLAPIVLANVLIGVLIARSLVKNVVLAFSYRSRLV
jgi:hypothetical protein